MKWCNPAALPATQEWRFNPQPKPIAPRAKEAMARESPMLRRSQLLSAEALSCLLPCHAPSLPSSRRPHLYQPLKEGGGPPRFVFPLSHTVPYRRGMIARDKQIALEATMESIDKLLAQSKGGSVGRLASSVFLGSTAGSQEVVDEERNKPVDRVTMALGDRSQSLGASLRDVSIHLGAKEKSPPKRLPRGGISRQRDSWGKLLALEVRPEFVGTGTAPPVSLFHASQQRLERRMQWAAIRWGQHQAGMTKQAREAEAEALRVRQEEQAAQRMGVTRHEFLALQDQGHRDHACRKAVSEALRAADIKGSGWLPPRKIRQALCGDAVLPQGVVVDPTGLERLMGTLQEHPRTGFLRYHLLTERLVMEQEVSAPDQSTLRTIEQAGELDPKLWLERPIATQLDEFRPPSRAPRVHGAFWRSVPPSSPLRATATEPAVPREKPHPPPRHHPRQHDILPPRYTMAPRSSVAQSTGPERRPSVALSQDSVDSEWVHSHLADTTDLIDPYTGHAVARLRVLEQANPEEDTIELVTKTLGLSHDEPVWEWQLREWHGIRDSWRNPSKKETRDTLDRLDAIASEWRASVVHAAFKRWRRIAQDLSQEWADSWIVSN
jgi:hypothetical protein